MAAVSSALPSPSAPKSRTFLDGASAEKLEICENATKAMALRSEEVDFMSWGFGGAVLMTDRAAWRRRSVHSQCTATMEKALLLGQRFEKIFHQSDSLGIVELLPAVDGAGDDDELHGKPGFLIGGGEFLRLLGWHLRIGVAVDEEQGRVVCVDVLDGTGELGEVGFF